MLKSFSPDQFLAFFWMIFIVLFAAGTSRFVLWLFHRAPAPLVRHRKLTPLEQAYLVGGELRVLELAIFQLVRDGALKKNSHGVFQVRLDPDSNAISQTEFEIIKSVDVRGAMALDEILGLRPRSLAEIRKELVGRNLLLTAADEKKCRSLSTAPIFLAVVYCLRELKIHLDFGMSPGKAWALSLVALAVLAIARGRSSQRTSQGDRTVAKLLRLSRERDRETYDRIWKMKDTVLFRGLKSISSMLTSVEEDRHS